MTVPILPAIAFPMIDPVLVQFGPLAIRWYSLAYVAGLLFAWWYIRRLLDAYRRAGHPAPMTALDTDDLLFWATLGVVLGGRLGYVLFYQPSYYFAHPAEILAVWQGGMSFHGGFLGVVAALVVLASRRSLSLLAVSDLLACAAPLGLMLGRVANFINGELFGRTSDVPWAMVFPGGGTEARHPSQLYEAALEGALLFALMGLLFRFTGVRKYAGALTGIFLIGYAAARGIGELFREPDLHIGFLAGGTTMGQLLSLPLGVLGLYLLARARRHGPQSGRGAAP
jgi:phosphatidylglycerol:prolipoprotein diacylglycerol transferase